jgi:hypothetical protein
MENMQYTCKECSTDKIVCHLNLNERKKHWSLFQLRKNCCCVLKWGSLFLHNLFSWCYLKQHVGTCFCFLKTLLNLKMKILLLNHFEAFWGSHFNQILRWVLLILPFRVLFLKVTPIKIVKIRQLQREYNENDR